MPASPKQMTLNLPDVDLCVFEWGVPGGQQVLLVHATGFHARCWDQIVAGLPEDWHIFAVDMRGHGRSGNVPPYKWPQFGSDLLHVCEMLGLKDAIGVGHSMGGHGALTLAMGLKDRFRSVSAFSPICNPTTTDWGRKQLSAYLGPNESTWEAHDATLQMRANGLDIPLLIDIGTDDQFMTQLKPEALAAAAMERRIPCALRLQEGYDHSYFFVSTFIEEHITFHAEALYS